MNSSNNRSTFVSGLSGSQSVRFLFQSLCMFQSVKFISSVGSALLLNSSILKVMQVSSKPLKGIFPLENLSKIAVYSKSSPSNSEIVSLVVYPRHLA